MLLLDADLLLHTLAMMGLNYEAHLLSIVSMANGRLLNPDVFPQVFSARVRIFNLPPTKFGAR